MVSEEWREVSKRATQKVLNDIPVEWKVAQDRLPAEDVRDVTAFPATCGLLDPKQVEMTESLATEIVAKVGSGEWTAEDVTRAFCKRAAIAHQLTNCLSVIMFADALERAKQLDAEFTRTGKPTGPLHGLPISLKDNFKIPGYPSSAGFCSWAESPMQEESTIVTILKSLGAIPYVKTNVPTAMMIAETVNNVYGRTTNPLNRATTAGGSSGGESALIALRGSPLGVGSDIGGSLRIPAACTGIFTLRPSFGRLPQFDARSGLAGQEAILSVHGPLARSVADLRLYTESVVDGKPWERDPKCLEIPWRESPATSRPKPKLAVLWDNGLVHPTPPVARALRETVAKLKDRGYEIVDWPATDHAEADALMAKFFLADGGKSLRNILEPVGEPFRPELVDYEQAKEMGVHELWQLQIQRTALCKRYLDRWASFEGLDAILSPTTPYASPKNGQFRHVGYTGIFNIVDYSSTSFPCGIFVDRDKDARHADRLTPYSAVDAQIQEEYDPVVSHGLPVSLQLAAKRLQEEKVLALTEMVVGDLK